MITVKEVIQQEISHNPVVRLGHIYNMAAAGSSKEEVCGNESNKKKYSEMALDEIQLQKSAHRFRPA